MLLLVAAAVTATARQLSVGRNRAALPPQPGIPGRPSLPPASDDPDYPPPIRFQQYAVVEFARGGVGTVFRATHPLNGQTYAIKQLNRQFVNDQLVIDAFHRGGAMLMHLNHPNIVKVYYDWVERNESLQDHFFVMEYLAGETLNELIRRDAPLAIDERLLRVVGGIGEAVSYLHANEIIHRDIKPENFRLSEGRYKLLDFDTAMTKSQRGLLAQDGMPVGTPEYMSPEQARGAVDIDARADVYSFGILLYELVTAAVPFTGAPSRVLIDQMETPPRSPLALNSRIPAAAADVILMALHKDRDRRFQSIHALLAAFGNACAAAGVGQIPEREAPR